MGILDREARVCFNGGMSNDTTAQYPRVLDIARPKKCLPTKCHRCGGAGGWQGWPGFTCYRCGGCGQDPTYRSWGYPAAWTDEQCAEFVAEREARNEAKRQRAENRRAEEAEAIWTDNRLKWSITLDLIAQMVANDEATYLPAFALDIYRKARQYLLTDAQGQAMADAVTKAQQRIQDRKLQPDPEPVPTGDRIEIEGKIVSLKWYESDFGATQKMVVLGDGGWRVFVTVPSKLSVEVDDRVRFSAQVSASDNDPTFGFGKRPTKAEVL